MFDHRKKKVFSFHVEPYQIVSSSITDLLTTCSSKHYFPFIPSNSYQILNMSMQHSSFQFKFQKHSQPKFYQCPIASFIVPSQNQAKLIQDNFQFQISFTFALSLYCLFVPLNILPRSFQVQIYSLIFHTFQIPYHAEVG